MEGEEEEEKVMKEEEEKERPVDWALLWWTSVNQDHSPSSDLECEFQLLILTNL